MRFLMGYYFRHLTFCLDPDDPCFDWFVKALTILGHFSPSVVALSYKVGADEPFRSLTLWLEDRIIRSW